MCRNTAAMARFRRLDSLLVLLFLITASTAQQAVPRLIVDEGSDVTLPCSLGNNHSIVTKVFDWKKTHQDVFLYARGAHYNNGRTGQDEQFRGRVSHFPEELDSGNASIVIRNTVVADSGNYTCIFPGFQAYRTFPIELVVCRVLKDRSAENIPGAAPKPHIVMLNATKDGVPLLCEVGGAAPEPRLQWQDSDGNVCPAEEPQVSERGGRYFVSLLATVTRTTTNRFRCVASQEDVHHRTHTDIDVPGKMFEECKPSDQVFSPDTMLGLGVLIGVILTVAVFVIVWFFIRRRRRDAPQRNRPASPDDTEQLQVDVPNGRVIEMADGGPTNGHVGHMADGGPTNGRVIEMADGGPTNGCVIEMADGGPTNGRVGHMADGGPPDGHVGHMADGGPPDGCDGPPSVPEVSVRLLATV